MSLGRSAQEPVTLEDGKGFGFGWGGEAQVCAY